MNFINLSNGLEAIKEYNLTEYRFIRIQSTWCEQKLWDDILLALSDDFLMCAARGEPCVVYDYGARKPTPRAIWQGLEWVKFVLNKRWHDINYIPIGKVSSAGKYFEKQCGGLKKRTKTRLDYFGKFTVGDVVNISAITKATTKDGSW